MEKDTEKKIYEINNSKKDNVDEKYTKNDEVPMSNGENCGIVEFEDKRINTCKGEKIVENGYESPDR